MVVIYFSIGTPNRNSGNLIVFCYKDQSLSLIIAKLQRGLTQRAIKGGSRVGSALNLITN